MSRPRLAHPVLRDINEGIPVQAKLKALAAPEGEVTDRRALMVLEAYQKGNAQTKKEIGELVEKIEEEPKNRDELLRQALAVYCKEYITTGKVTADRIKPAGMTLLYVPVSQAVQALPAAMAGDLIEQARTPGDIRLGPRLKKVERLYLYTPSQMETDIANHHAFHG